MTRLERALAAAVLAATVLTAGGCAAKQAVGTVVQQGVETTTTGQHDVAPANNAQNAVDNLNTNIDQGQQQAQGLGQ